MRNASGLGQTKNQLTWGPAGLSVLFGDHIPVWGGGLGGVPRAQPPNRVSILSMWGGRSCFQEKIDMLLSEKDAVLRKKLGLLGTKLDVLCAKAIVLGLKISNLRMKSEDGGNPRLTAASEKSPCDKSSGVRNESVAPTAVLENHNMVLSELRFDHSQICMKISMGEADFSDLTSDLCPTKIDLCC